MNPALAQSQAQTIQTKDLMGGQTRSARELCGTRRPMTMGQPAAFHSQRGSRAKQSATDTRAKLLLKDT